MSQFQAPMEETKATKESTEFTGIGTKIAVSN